MSTLTTTPLKTLTGADTTLADFTGKVLLLVNVASKCGLTPQYTALEALYQRFKDRGFAVIGFPANDFAGQEPGTNEEIATFCSTEYPVTFPLMAKVPVTGPDKDPVYKELIAAQPTATTDPASGWRKGLEDYSAKNGYPPPTTPPELLWNFEKFLLGKDGTVLARFAPDMTPDDPRITAAIESALTQ